MKNINLSAPLDFYVDYDIPRMHLPNNYRLIKANDVPNLKGKNIREIALIKENVSSKVFDVVYVINLIIHDNLPLSTKSCAHVSVTRSMKPQHQKPLLNFATTIFEDLTSEYIVMISDTESTNYVRGFWLYRVLEALDDKKYIYSANHDILTGCMSVALRNMKTEQEFLDLWFDHGWNTDEDYKDRVFLISKEMLN